MKNTILVFLFLSIISCKSQTDSKTTVIDLSTLKTEAIGKDVQLIDVRTPAEYKAGHIDDAINIDVLEMKTFVQEAEKLDKTKPIYLYCKIGGRSKQASKKLEELGFTTIYDFSSGYDGWKKTSLK